MSKIFEEQLKKTSLHSRLLALNQLDLIDFLVEIGFRDNKVWTEDEDELLMKLNNFALKITNDQLEVIEKFNNDQLNN